MERDIDGATKLSCVDAEDVHFATRGSDQDVVLAWVNLKARDLSIIDEELRHGCHTQSVILHLYQLLLDAVRSTQ